jgi:hypothetical protein
MPDTERFACGQCTRTDLTLTANGRVRSHAANGKRPGPDNPHCGGGSDWPKHEHAYSNQETDPEAPPLCDVCGEPDPRPTQKEVDSALFVGPIGEIDVPPEVEAAAEDVMARARDHGIRQPNPHRPPLPGGLHDNMAQKEETQVTPSADPAAAPSADDFLGSDVPEEDRSGSYFTARYDGSCDTCGADFAEGDQIRRAPSGGWEAEACCGEELDEEAERRPRATAPQLPVRNGRYRGPHPDTGKDTAWTRSTTFAEAIADSYTLNEWQLRMAVLGLVKRPELLERVRSMVQAHNGIPLYELAKLQRQVLNGITEDARLAAGSKERARKGTILHKHTQEIDMGRKSAGDVPEEFRPDAQAYLLAMTHYGLECIPDLIERSTAYPPFEVAGTFDRILRVTRTLDPVVLDDGRTVQLHEGDHVIGDVKSGTDLSYAWLEILIQLAVYMLGVTTSGIAVPDTGPQGTPVWRWASLAEFGIDKLRTDVAIVMHVPYGEGRAQLKYADLITGQRGAKICRNAIEYRKIKPGHEVATGDYTITPKPVEFVAAGGQASGHAKWVTAGTKRAEAAAVVNAAPVSPPTTTRKRLTWEEVAGAVRTKEEANTIWSKMKGQKIDDARIKSCVAIMREKLTQVGA